MHNRNLILDLPGIGLLDHNGLVFQLVEDCHSVSEELAVTLCLDRRQYLIPSENAIVEDASVLNQLVISSFFLLFYQISRDFNLIGVGHRYSSSHLCYLQWAVRLVFTLEVVALYVEQIPLHVKSSHRVVLVINEEISKRILRHIVYFQPFFCASYSPRKVIGVS